MICISSTALPLPLSSMPLDEAVDLSGGTRPKLSARARLTTLPPRGLQAPNLDFSSSRCRVGFGLEGPASTMSGGRDAEGLRSEEYRTDLGKLTRRSMLALPSIWALVLVDAERRCCWGFSGKGRRGYSPVPSLATSRSDGWDETLITGRLTGTGGGGGVDGRRGRWG